MFFVLLYSFGKPYILSVEVEIAAAALNDNVPTGFLAAPWKKH